MFCHLLIRDLSFLFTQVADDISLRIPWVYLLFSVPVGIVTSIVNLIPYLGAVIAIALSIYSIVLNIFSIMAVHRLSGGKATAVVLIPLGVALLLACALVVLFVTLIVAMMQHH